MKKTHLSLLVASTLLPLSAFAASNTATVLSVKPSVTSTYQGKTAVLAIKNEVPIASVVRSDKQGRAQLTFPDNSTISITPNTEIALEDFVDEPQSQNIVLKLATGTARVVTGEVSRKNPNAFTLKTPQATMGIRGTIVTVAVSGETTKVYLTQTTGAGVTVTPNSTDQPISLTTPGNVIIVAPEGVTERPLTPSEAQEIRVGVRGEEPRGNETPDQQPESSPLLAGELNTSANGSNSLMGDDPMLNETIYNPAQETSQGLDISLISGHFFGTGTYLNPNFSDDTSNIHFDVDAQAIITNAVHYTPGQLGEISFDPGTINSDGSFNLSGSEPNISISGLSSASMTGQFNTIESGSWAVTRQDNSYSDSGTFIKVEGPIN